MMREEETNARTRRSESKFRAGLWRGRWPWYWRALPGAAVSPQWRASTGKVLGRAVIADARGERRGTRERDAAGCFRPASRHRATPCAGPAGCCMACRRASEIDASSSGLEIGRLPGLRVSARKRRRGRSTLRALKTTITLHPRSPSSPPSPTSRPPSRRPSPSSTPLASASP